MMSFYGKSQIDAHLKCPACGETCYDPRNLPCGECVCQQCITERLETPVHRPYNGSFVCFRCNLMHKMPEGGAFPVCKPMARLVGEKPEDVFRGKNYETLKDYLRQIRDSIDELRKKSNSAVEVIRAHCELARNDIDITAESKIEEVLKRSRELRERVDAYERDCVANYASASTPSDSLTREIADHEAFCVEWQRYLLRTRFDEGKAHRNHPLK